MSTLAVESLEVRFGRTLALKDVSLALGSGRTLAVVGESGSGKSTLVRAIVGMERPSAGDILLDGQSVLHEGDRRRTRFRHRVQMVFQDPYSSLNPTMSIGDALEEAVMMRERGSRTLRQAEVARLLDMVALPASAATRRPHEFSGGQRQRIAIARALAMKPEIVLADEITSALDVSVQAQILNLLREIQAASSIAVLFITHNLAVARYVADEVMVMRDGYVVERGGVEVFDHPQEPYTQQLLAAVEQPVIETES